MSLNDDDVVLAGATRTPTGRLLGGLTGYSAPELGAIVVGDALARTGIDGTDVDEVIMGNVIQAGVGQNPARQSALFADLPPEVAAFTVNKVCGSGLKSVVLAAQAVKLGDADIVVAGGMESMTNAPHMTHLRRGKKFGGLDLVDSMEHDGLRDVYNEFLMGVTGEIVAEEFGVTREAADELALRSHQRAAKATEAGAFEEEIVTVEAKPAGRRGRGEEVTTDEGIRADTTLEALSGLRTPFKDDGVVTAGNASQISDGASALVVTRAEVADERGLDVLGVIEGYATAGVEPERVMAAPIPGVEKLFEETGMTIDDVDLFEHNEAFATASCAVRSSLSVPDEKFNVRGGAVALGHPLGASGARILTTLLYALKQEGGTRGVATLCLGGGNSVQMMVRRP